MSLRSLSSSALALASFSFALGAFATPGPVSGPQLTPEQARILRHMSLIQLDDGLGNMVTTIRVTGANLQIVNGLGATDSENGAGNLIVGYNAFGNPEGDLRT